MAIDRLRDRDLAIDDISVVERDPTRYRSGYDYTNADWEYNEYTTEEIGDETAGGLVLGGLVGGTLGTLAGLGALVIPGIGPVVAAGPLVGALVGGTAGAVTGTLAGALIEAFEVPEEHAEVYSRRLSEGNTMVAVHVDPINAGEVREIFRTSNAERFDWAEEPVTAEREYIWV
ncbi:MAG: general stress protein [Ardenticatenaceae bacterium]